MTSRDGVEALLAMDRLDVSAQLFAGVFEPLVDEPLPRVTLKALAGRLSAQHGIDWKHGRFLAGLPKRPREATVLRMTLDLVVGWELAGLAARISDSENDGTTTVVLTVAGGELLRRQHATEAVRDVLVGRDGRRSFAEA